jgi:hypothetical protein
MTIPVGTKVWVNQEWSIFYRLTGVVLDFGTMYEVKLDNPGEKIPSVSYFDEKELTIIQEESVLKVGDKVTHPHYAGEQEVLYIYDSGAKAVVKNSSGREFSVLTDSLTKVPDFDPNARNPHAPSVALTYADIKPGLKARLVVSGKVGKVYTIRSEPFVSEFGSKKVAIEGTYSDHILLGDYGVTSWGEGNWASEYYMIPDTTDAVLAVLQK